MFGPHLILDLYGCRKDKLRDKFYIKEFLEYLPNELGLTKISEAVVNYYKTPTPGISGFILISESHITVHTFIEEGYAAIDIFSCKEFDADLATKIISETFEPKKLERKLLNRGVHYPMSLRKAIQRNLRERVTYVLK